MSTGNDPIETVNENLSNLLLFSKEGHSRTFLNEYFDDVINQIDQDVEVCLLAAEKQLNKIYTKYRRNSVNQISVTEMNPKLKDFMTHLESVRIDLNENRAESIDLIRKIEQECISNQITNQIEINFDREQLNEVYLELKKQFESIKSDFNESKEDDKLDLLKIKLNELDKMIDFELNRFKAKTFLNRTIFYRPVSYEFKRLSEIENKSNFNIIKPEKYVRSNIPYHISVGKLVYIKNAYFDEDFVQIFRKMMDRKILNKLSTRNSIEKTMENFKIFFSACMYLFYSQQNSLKKLNENLIYMFFILFDNFNKFDQDHVIEYDSLYFLNSFKYLDDLDLDKTTIEILEPGTFKAFKNLKKLSLASNSLNSLNRLSLEDLVSLKILNLSSNMFVELADYLFTPLKNLEELDLKYNSIKSIQLNAFEGLENLKVLNLWKNEIETKSESNEETTIVKLNANHFKHTKELIKLVLRNNKITKLNADQFESLNKLADLDLHGNQLIEIESNAFNNLNNMIILNLSVNFISALNENLFKNFIYLEDLYLSGNSISTINENLFNGLRRLKRLHFSSNSLVKIEANTFISLTYLLELTLNDNQIKSIERDAFRSLNQLKLLNLSNNNLEKIESYHFLHLNRLEQLNLSKNQIVEIDHDAFGFQPNLFLREIDLTSNPILTEIESNGYRFNVNEYKHLNFVDKVLV